MKLIRAKFKNFRLLRDVTLDFSTDNEKRLTVIRAANETGKTTILYALQWALYGDEALPGWGIDFRLSPIDWDSSTGRKAAVTVEVDFEISAFDRFPGGLHESRQRYRIVRTVDEEVDRHNVRRPSTVSLFELKEQGASPINHPESLINAELPPELREVFFTDGDQALGFIEADAGVASKRQRVQKAIRSLLGLGIIEEAIRHLDKTTYEVNKQARSVGGEAKLGRIANSLLEIDQEIATLERQRDDAKHQFAEFEKRYNDTDREITEILKQGNREELSAEWESTKLQTKGLNEQITGVKKKHAALFRSPQLETALLAPIMDLAFARLEQLHVQGEIPNSTLPVLEDRLEAGVCICGESLAPDHPSGHQRREYIQKLIDDSRHADEIGDTIASLYYEARNQRQSINATTWQHEYKEVGKSRETLQSLWNEASRKSKGLELKIAALPDVDTRELYEARQHYRDMRDRAIADRSQAETRLAKLVVERKQLSEERDRLLREQAKGARILAQLEVVQDISNVLASVYAQITHEELAKVSQLMNEIFLEMIGADPEQGILIRRAEINQDFDIVVYGPYDRLLNPDRDLNGASRRALTLAFILALTKVSEVEAPNVIDTPLGMTSGYVKRSILRTAVRESSQLILFLTHDEIAGCEDIIDEEAGMVFTLTNPAHYPKMLVNDPGVSELNVIRCGCDHRSECATCQRRGDAQG